MMKKIIISAIAVLVLSGAVLLGVFFFGGTGETPGGASGTIPANQAGGPSNTTNTNEYPQGSTTKISGANGMVEVKNFYRNIVGTDETSVVIARHDGYSTSYDMANGSFWIGLREGASIPLRTAAENELLDILGISQDVACSLNIQVGPRFTPMSFCPGAVVL